MGNFLLGLFIGWTVTTVTTVVMYATGVEVRWIADWLQDKPARPGPVSLEVLIKAAQAHAARMTPEQRAEQTAAFRRSWVIGDLSIRHPEMSREDIERLVDDVIADMQSGEN